MATIKGQNLRIFVNGKVVAMATSCTLHCQAQVNDNSTKDDGEWTGNQIVSLSWDASVDALISADSGLAFDNDIPELFYRYRNKKPVGVSLSLASGANNSTGGTVLLSGSAIISDLVANAPNRMQSSYTCQLTGIEELVQGAQIRGMSFELPITILDLAHATDPVIDVVSDAPFESIVQNIKIITNKDSSQYRTYVEQDSEGRWCVFYEGTDDEYELMTLFDKGLDQDQRTIGIYATNEQAAEDFVVSDITIL